MKSVYTYILDDNGNAQPEDDPIQWAKWMKYANRKLRQTNIGPYLVSTVFLGVDHLGMLWETIVFRDREVIMMDQYKTKQQAIKGHEAMCEKITVKGKKR